MARVLCAFQNKCFQPGEVAKVENRALAAAIKHSKTHVFPLVALTFSKIVYRTNAFSMILVGDTVSKTSVLSRGVLLKLKIVLWLLK